MIDGEFTRDKFQDQVKTAFCELHEAPAIASTEVDSRVTLEVVDDILDHLDTFVTIGPVKYALLEKCFEEELSDETIFFEKKNAIKAFCLGKTKVTLGGDRSLTLSDQLVFSQKDVFDALKVVIGRDNVRSAKSHSDLKQLHEFLGFSK